MKRRTLLAASAAVPFTGVSRAQAQTGKTKVVWWHAMTGVNAEEIDRLARVFSEGQGEAEVQPIYKGSYADTLTAAIAAWRADQAPHLVQIFEVGTGSMLAAGPATKQVWKLAEETGVVDIFRKPLRCFSLCHASARSSGSVSRSRSPWRSSGSSIVATA